MPQGSRCAAGEAHKFEKVNWILSTLCNIPTRVRGSPSCMTFRRQELCFSVPADTRTDLVRAKSPNLKACCGDLMSHTSIEVEGGEVEVEVKEVDEAA